MERDIRKRTIVVVSLVPTHPVISGNRQRVYYMLRHLQAGGYRVCFVYLQSCQEEQPGHIEAMRACWDRVVVVPYRWPWEREADRRWHRGLRGLCQFLMYHGTIRGTDFLKWLLGKPVYFFCRDLWRNGSLDLWYDERISAGLARVAEEERPETVIVEYAAFAKALDHFPGARKFIDTHDILGFRNQRMLLKGAPSFWLSLWPWEERRGIRKADTVIAITPADARYFRRQGAPDVTVIGHLVPPQASLEQGSENRHRILFLGSMNPNNARALRWLVSRVWPRVIRRTPDAQLVIAGGVSRGAAGLPDGCEIVGPVDDLAGLYRRCDIVVNPEICGTGVSIKSLEAASFGCPLVTTRIGARGLEAFEEAGAIGVVRSSGAFARRLSDLILDPAGRKSLGANAARMAAVYYTDQAAEMDRVFPPAGRTRDRDDRGQCADRYHYTGV